MNRLAFCSKKRVVAFCPPFCQNFQWLSIPCRTFSNSVPLWIKEHTLLHDKSVHSLLGLLALFGVLIQVMTGMAKLEQ